MVCLEYISALALTYTHLGVLLIMLNRFHNYVVEQLAAINENGRFHKPSEGLTHEMAEKSWAKYDNDLFQTGRLITCGK